MEYRLQRHLPERILAPRRRLPGTRFSCRRLASTYVWDQEQWPRDEQPQLVRFL